MDPQALTLAYKYVALAIMLGEINYFASQLQLPINQPVKEQDLKAPFFVDPRKMPFSGRLDTEEYSFSIGEGRLRFVTNLQGNRGEMSMREYNEKLSKRESLVDTNLAYQIARGWLKVVDVDVERLEKECRPHAEQLFFNADSGAMKHLPVYVVKWGDPIRPAVRVSLNGATTNLLFLRQEDISYSRRPALLIKELDKLLAISDEEFAKYTLEQRSNLVARFTAVEHVAVTNRPPSLRAAPSAGKR